MYVVAVIAMLFSCALMGQLLCYVFKLKIPENYQTLVAQVLGLLAILTLYAIYLTGGKTVHLGFILLGGIAFFVLKEEDYILADRRFLALFPNANWRAYALLTMIMTGWGLYFYVVFQQYTYGQAGSLSLIFEDMLYYAMIGEWISQSGQESQLGSSLVLDASFKGMSPYHYFELYFGQLLVDVFGLNSLKTHIYCTNTFSVGLVSYATFVFAKAMVGEKASTSFLALSLLAVAYSGIKLPIPLQEAGHYTINLLEVNTIKFAFLFLFFLITTFLALQRSRLFVLPLMVIPMMSYAMFPLMVMVLVILGILSYGYYYKKGLDYKLLHLYTVGGLLLTAFLFGIYQLWGFGTEFQLVKIDLMMISSQLLAEWRSNLGIIVGTHLYFLVDYLPYGLVLGGFWVFATKDKSISIQNIPLQLIIIPILFMGSCLVWCVLRSVTHEAFQVHAIMTGFVGNLGIVFLTILVYKHLSKHQNWFLCCQVVLLAYLFYGILCYNGRTYSRERAEVIPMDCISSSLPLIKDSKARIATLDSTLRKHEVYPFAPWLLYYKQKIILTSISPVLLSSAYDKVSWTNDQANGMTRLASPFYRYVRKLQEQNSFMDVTSAQLSFLKAYQFDYLLVQPNFELDGQLLSNLDLVVECSCYRMYRLKTR